MGTSTTANAAEAEAIETKTRRKGCFSFSFSTFAFVVTTPPGISSSSSSRFGRTRRPFSVNYHRRPPPLPSSHQKRWANHTRWHPVFLQPRPLCFLFLSCAALYFNWVDDETLMANRSLDGRYINAAQAGKGSFLKDTNAPWQKLEKGQKYINTMLFS